LQAVLVTRTRGGRRVRNPQSNVRWNAKHILHLITADCGRHIDLQPAVTQIDDFDTGRFDHGEAPLDNLNALADKYLQIRGFVGPLFQRREIGSHKELPRPIG